MKHDTFIFRRAWYDAICSLPEESRLEVYEAICQYDSAHSDRITDMVSNPVARGVFIVIKADIDKTLANYEAVLVKRSEAGKKGMKSRWHSKHNKDNKCYDVITNVTSVTEDNKNNKHNKDNNNTHTHNIDISDKNNNSDDSNNSDISDRTTTRTHTRTRKKEDTPVEERRKKFGLSLEPYLGQYPRKMLSRFYDHWGELTKDKKKMRWELEKTWELERRLSKWASNEKQELSGQSPEPESRIDKIEDAGEGAREILRQIYQQQTNVPQLNN